MANVVKRVPTFDDVRTVLRWIWGHPSNRGRRLRATLCAVHFQLRGRLLMRRSCVPLGTHSRIWVDLHRTSASKAAYANPPDHPEMLVWAAHLRPGDIFVDVGANVGTYTVWAGDLGAEVIAFEPAPDTFALLAENVALNGYRVDLIQAAAGAQSGSTRFTVGLDSTNRVDVDGPHEVAVVALDDIIGERVVAGIKVDVEGYELDVLLGARSCLQAGRIRLLQLEWNEQSEHIASHRRNETADLLHRFGYELYRPDRNGKLSPAGRYPATGVDVFARQG